MFAPRGRRPLPPAAARAVFQATRSLRPYHRAVAQPSPSTTSHPARPALAVGPFERAFPNLLTGARVLLAVAFFAILTPWKYKNSPLARGEGPDWWLIAAAAVFIVAAITDALDGYLARRWN